MVSLFLCFIKPSKRRRRKGSLWVWWEIVIVFAIIVVAYIIKKAIGYLTKIANGLATELNRKTKEVWVMLFVVWAVIQRMILEKAAWGCLAVTALILTIGFLSICFIGGCCSLIFGNWKGYPHDHCNLDWRCLVGWGLRQEFYQIPSWRGEGIWKWKAWSCSSLMDHSGE